MDEILIEATSASLGGLVSSTALFPLEIIKTKMQAMDGGKKKGQKKGQKGGDEEGGDEDEEGCDSEPTAMGVANDIYASNGVLGFYKGVHYSSLQSMMEKGLYFIAYTGLKSVWKGITGTDEIGTFSNLGLGCAAEWCQIPFTIPLDVLTTAIATDTQNRGAYAIMSTLLATKGISGMYNGVEAYIVLCLKPSIQYTVFERVKTIVLASRGTGEDTLGAAEAFVLGMIARLVATIVVFPYTRAKVMIQAGKGAAGVTIPDMLAEIYKDKGMKGIFQGIGPELTRGVMSAALMMMVKEKIHGGVKTFIKGQPR
ncbi:hypothetical protein TrRE_jg12479 [Triparma retinervis]|uniref:Uncharacterized protein n=1 Tax=Triparma retinervis TaxID=2557542 RepID=A0A9W7E902_9STRA|nr:hypothetical protein TrRE_jg12479 [Triparma retinervis]